MTPPVGITVISFNIKLTLPSFILIDPVVCFIQQEIGGHGGRVVTLSPPTSKAGVQFPARPQVGKLVVACRWSAVYSTEP